MIWISILRFLISLTFFTFVLLRALDISIKKLYLITKKYIPKYKEVIAQYNATYPCIMDCIYTKGASLEQRKAISNLHSFFFIKDDSFIVVSDLNPNIYVQLPFNSLIYHDSEIIGNYGDKYCFCIRLFFSADIEIGEISFSTLDYHHKIDKIIHKLHPGMLNDENLYDFICENFPNEEDYKRKCNFERSNITDSFFETSIFHKFTNIDAE